MVPPVVSMKYRPEYLRLVQPVVLGAMMVRAFDQVDLLEVLVVVSAVPVVQDGKSHVIII